MLDIILLMSHFLLSCNLYFDQSNTAFELFAFCFLVVELLELVSDIGGRSREKDFFHLGESSRRLGHQGPSFMRLPERGQPSGRGLAISYSSSSRQGEGPI